MTLVAGSYEKYIWGFSVKNLTSSAASKTLSLNQVFSYSSHGGPIKSVATAGPIAASGGADDTIKIYDLASHSEIGSLIDHSGAVTALAFYTCPLAPSLPRNLISAAEDGNVCIFDADPIVHLKTIPVHRRGVSDLALHPSGRLALTVGRDSCLAMVNLVRGRRSFSCHLDREATIVRYGSEERFYMVAEERISAHDAKDAKIVHEMSCQKRVLCIATGESGILFAGGEDKNVVAWDTLSGKVAYCIDGAHSTRVKGLAIFKRTNSGSSEESFYLASASSDGVIRVWDLRMISKEKPTPLAESNTKSRLTCLTGSSI
ncbi:hypothetical protein HPP92_011845 [Vanilla planifolia]|uniref:P21-activated protein kinase-interacting protein 1-like n=1 Tax=Vanilla planifolia TaxID=51239 RepID=A0A835V343_VANPL|nr:hypothetical protein HPP92_012189 [Vanilla planifolia]KAG0483761.1 hypothetical protein HPP92_011845 [Vanilla planifolia]